MTQQNHHVPMLSSTSLIGTEVINRQDEHIGKIEDIMIDLATGRVGYVVMSFGGIMGIGNKLFAVPWASLYVDQDREKIVMDADKELLKRAPGFDKNDWPQHPNGLWVNEVYTFYGHEPYWTKTP